MRYIDDTLCALLKIAVTKKYSLSETILAND